MTSETLIREAVSGDLERLVELEEKAFKSDRFKKRQFRYLLKKGRCSIFILEYQKQVAGMAIMLWRKKVSVGRLYDIIIDPVFQGKGLAKLLLEKCELEAVRKKRRGISLEVRTDNRAAIVFYEKHGYRTLVTIKDYYSDHSPALKMLKDLNPWSPAEMKLKVPYYAQTEEFSCGPACLMMAFKYFKPEPGLGRLHEMILWKEATLIYMTSGFGGTGPFGLALAAKRRGFPVKVIMSREQTPFFSSVRNPEKRKVIRLIHKDFRAKAETYGVMVDYHNFSFDEIVEEMKKGWLPIVLISTYHLHGDRAPHWVVITGYDAENVYFHDPYEKFYEDEKDLARNVKIPLAEFRQMRRYGRDLYKSVLFIGPPEGKPTAAMDGTDLSLVKTS
nr:GNAT family N-acetyltransferase/peptidase C39 family protein [candidate division Zixibacteria bacterium]